MGEAMVKMDGLSTLNATPLVQISPLNCDLTRWFLAGLSVSLYQSTPFAILGNNSDLVNRFGVRAAIK